VRSRPTERGTGNNWKTDRARKNGTATAMNTKKDTKFNPRETHRFRHSPTTSDKRGSARDEKLATTARNAPRCQSGNKLAGLHKPMIDGNTPPRDTVTVVPAGGRNWQAPSERSGGKKMRRREISARRARNLCASANLTAAAAIFVCGCLCCDISWHLFFFCFFATGIGFIF
jgi:hypothetical protein